MSLIFLRLFLFSASRARLFYTSIAFLPPKKNSPSSASASNFFPIPKTFLVFLSRFNFSSLDELDVELDEELDELSLEDDVPLDEDPPLFDPLFFFFFCFLFFAGLRF